MTLIKLISTTTGSNLGDSIIDFIKKRTDLHVSTLTGKLYFETGKKGTEYYRRWTEEELKELIQDYVIKRLHECGPRGGL